jgi:hypothetical protein
LGEWAAAELSACYSRLLANVATVFVRVFFREHPRDADGPPPREISQSKILAMLMSGGSSYCVPVWLDYRHGDNPVWQENPAWLDVQYGAKWGPAPGPDTLWEHREKNDVAALWVRWFDEGGDFDAIFTMPDKESGRPCRYAFDEVEVRFAEGVERRRLAGTYLCGNDRVAPRYSRMVPSPTTEPGSTSSVLGDVQPQEAADALTDLRARAQEISLFYGRRLVHLSRRRKDGWYDFALDDWDNCVDEEFRRAIGH